MNSFVISEQEGHWCSECWVLTAPKGGRERAAGVAVALLLREHWLLFFTFLYFPPSGTHKKEGRPRPGGTGPYLVGGIMQNRVVRASKLTEADNASLK